MAIVVCSLSHFVVVIQMSVNNRKHDAISQQYDYQIKLKTVKLFPYTHFFGFVSALPWLLLLEWKKNIVIKWTKSCK